MVVFVGMFCALVDHVDGGCLVDDSTDGFLLPVLQVPGYGMCPKGYLCPNSYPSNVSTYPRVCPATAECLQQRLNSKFCPPQGTFEPYVCPAGSYCPTAYQQIPCPAGFYCPVGTTSPFKCAPISSCPTGTSVSYDYGSIVLLCVWDVMLVALHIYVRRKKMVDESRCSPSEVSADIKFGEQEMSSTSSCAWSSLAEVDRQRLCAAVENRRSPMLGMTFQFSNLSVTIPAADGNPEKVVLRSVSGTLRPGQVTAVMGPSGAGKTVFFTALLSKQDPSWITTGSLDINGQGPEQFEKFRHVIGYVPQDDSLHEDLSVHDNVWYSSEVRLPRHYSMEERDALRSVAMRGFGVAHLSRLLGSQLSASQKKKCSVAVEASCAPASLFLDEPTSALDATAAYDLCKGLTSLARESNMTVVMVIHQPRVEIWNGLDQVLFLAPGGFTVYQGSQKDAVGYFEEHLGFTFGHGNPADIIIDGIAEHCSRCIDAWDRFLQRQCTPTDAQQNGIRLPQPVAATPPEMVFPNADQPASFARQFTLSHNRSILKQSAHLSSVVLDVGLCMVAAAIMASAAVQTRYVGVLRSPYALISPKHMGYILAMLGMFYSIAIAATSSVTALRCFMGERECYWREMASGGHSRVAYYLGTIVAEVYRVCLTSLHFAVVAYFMLQPLQSFWQFFLIVLLLFVGFDSQASMLSMVAKPSSAPLFVSVAGVFVALLNGFPKIPMLNYVGFTFYLTEALMHQEMQYTNNLYSNVMNQYNMDRVHLDYIVAALLIFMYRVVGYLLMKLTNRDKQR